ncbi:MAG: asparagine synthase (glutamine-hydrolyzing) [Pseudomonas fluorescens]|nr:MAG: asparagine synthase (glutamine-hydrolyzing) [Pseudomonas fluorescens]
MCGIAGFFMTQGREANSSTAAALAEALVHRGPDGEGVWLKGAMGLVHRRLSIIDVEGGRQPLFANNGAIAGVMNGEIYNYKKLQGLVTDAGATLATGSDSEPMFHRYVQVGIDAALDELEGMFALCVADPSRGVMELATDRFGIKPLYYAETSVGFAFASEPRALVRSGWVRAEVNDNVIGGILNRHYSTGTETLFKNVYRLLPGEHITVKDGKIVARNRRLPGLAPVHPVEGDVVKEFGQRLTDAVGRHLVADVPFGLLLSGGLDSSAILCAMRDLGAPIVAYTAKIEVAGGVNEADAASALAKKVGATHITVPYTEADFWPALVDMAWAMDDLTTDYAAMPLLKLTKRAKQDVKILLSGEGGDEMLAGYSKYRKARGLLWHWRARRSGDATPHKSLFAERGLIKLPPVAAQAWDTSGFTTLQQRQSEDVAGWLCSDLLLKLDRTTMINGIEGRVPFLDDQFSSYAFGLPDEWKVKDNYGKYILRAHLETKGHGEMAWARKQGFSVAVGYFLKQKPQLVKALLLRSETVKRLLVPGAEAKLMGGLDHAKTANLAFSLVLLALWELMHVQGLSKDELLGEMVSVKLAN